MWQSPGSWPLLKQSNNAWPSTKKSVYNDLKIKVCNWHNSIYDITWNTPPPVSGDSLGITWYQISMIWWCTTIRITRTLFVPLNCYTCNKQNCYRYIPFTSVTSHKMEGEPSTLFISSGSSERSSKWKGPRSHYLIYCHRVFILYEPRSEWINQFQSLVAARSRDNLAT